MTGKNLPLKEEKVEANIKVNNVAKPPVEAAVKSPPRIAKKDVDPQMPNFNYFTQEDVDKVSLIKDKYEKLLENEDELKVDDVTEEKDNLVKLTKYHVFTDTDKHRQIRTNTGYCNV